MNPSKIFLPSVGKEGKNIPFIPSSLPHPPPPPSSPLTMRKKVILQYIAKDADRKASFKKRKKGLLKKANELSTRCGVKACVIIKGENDSQPEFWPSKEGVEQVVNEFNNLSVVEKTKKMVNQKTFTEERIKKLKDQLKKLRTENDHKEMTLVMKDCLNGSVSVQSLDLAQLHALGSAIKQNLRDINMRLEELESEGGESSHVPVSTPLDRTVPMVAIATSELVPPVLPLQGMPMFDMQNFQGLPMLSPDEAMTMGQMMPDLQNALMPPPMCFPEMPSFQNQVTPVMTPMPQMPGPETHNLQQPMLAQSPLSFPDSSEPWSPLSYQAFKDLMMPPLFPDDEAGPSNYTGQVQDANGGS